MTPPPKRKILLITNGPSGESDWIRDMFLRYYAPEPADPPVVDDPPPTAPIPRKNPPST